MNRESIEYIIGELDHSSAGKYGYDWDAVRWCERKLRGMLVETANPPIVIPQDNYDEQIDEIMCWFDFDKVAKAMDALDWKWASADLGVPQLGEIREQALELLIKVTRDTRRGGQGHRGSYSRGTGGFIVSLQDETLSLRFELEEWTSTVDIED